MKLVHIHLAFGVVCALLLVPFLFPDDVDFVGIRYENLRIGNQEDIILNIKIGLWRLMLGAKKNGISCHREFEIHCGWDGVPCWNMWGLRLCVAAAIMLITAAVLIGFRSGLSKWVPRCGAFAIISALMTIVFTGFITKAVVNRVGDSDGFLEFVCWSIGQGDSECLNTLLANCLTFQSGYSVGEEKPRGVSISISNDISVVLLSLILFLCLSILGIIIWCCFLRFVRRVVNSKEDDFKLPSPKKYKHQMLKPRKKDYGSSGREELMLNKTGNPRRAKSPVKVVALNKRFLPDSNPNVKLLW